MGGYLLKRTAATILLLGSLLFNAPGASALDRKEIYSRLEQIPVFVLINDKGNPILVSAATASKDKPQQAVYFFVSPEEAKKFEGLFKKSEPNLAKTAKLRAIPMSQALKFAEEQQGKKEPLKVEIVPREESVQYAFTLAKQINKELKNFPGLPLFALTDLTGKQVISVKRDAKKEPNQLYFFDEADAKGFYEGLKKRNPDLAAKTKISAAPFQNLLGIMSKMTKTSEADRIVLIPSNAALKYVQEITPKTAAPKSKP